MDHDEDTTPGWDAITTALETLYPGVEPRHYGTVVNWAIGGPDPLDGISVYPRDGHWHYVSYGMSELYDKESDNPDVSGWGFEFTFRLARTAGETEPPIWAANFLQNLARYVFNSGNSFAPGHHVDLNGPIALNAPDTAIRAIAFVEDPELGAVDTPHGRLAFLQIVGLTLDEYSVIERWDTHRLLEALAPAMPLLVTDLARADLTGDPAVAAAIEEGVRRDGSSTGFLYVEEAGWRADQAEPGAVITLTFGANPAARIGRVLEARLPHGRTLLVKTAEGAIGFCPGDRFTVEVGADGLVEVDIPPALLAELAAVLRPVAGTYRLTSADLAVEIVTSRIRGQNGEVVAEIG